MTTGRVCHFKLVLLGDTAVGKSCLVVRFVRDEFFEYQEPTIGGACFCCACPVRQNIKSVEIPCGVLPCTFDIVRKLVDGTVFVLLSVCFVFYRCVVFCLSCVSTWVGAVQESGSTPTR